MKNEDCLFCGIVQKKIHSEMIFENDDVIAFLDIRQETIGHTLVVSKYHSENILGLPDERLGPLFVTVKKVTKLLETSLAPAGFTISINHGRAAGQIIDHLHVHIVPRYEPAHIHRVQPSSEGALRALRDTIVGGV